MPNKHYCNINGKNNKNFYEHFNLLNARVYNYNSAGIMITG